MSMPRLSPVTTDIGWAQPRHAPDGKVQPRSELIWLDIARALAASLVLAGHLRAYVLRDFWQSGHLGPAWRAFYFVTSLQHDAVIVFFVLSGFLITKSISEQASAQRWSWRMYGIKRLSRLWIVLLPALLLTLAWDQLGMRLTGSALYSGGLNIVNHSTPMTPLSFLPSTFIGNAFFLQTIVVPAFGTDTPLWSLANEFWYYVLFPLFFFAFRSMYSWPVRTALFGAATVLCVGLLSAQCLLGLVWLMGYGTYLLQRHVRVLPKRYRISLAAAGAVLFAASLLIPDTLGLHTVAADFIIGIAFAALLVPLAGLDAPSAVARPAQLFAGFSYTLYAVHFPILAFLTSALFHNVRVAPGPRGLVILALLFTAVMAYAYVISLLFERNTPKIQALLLRGRRDVSLVAPSTKMA